MKNQSYIMNNESGFFLPYTLFITALIFIIITTGIRTYHHEIDITHHLVDQLKSETIIQMGLAKFNQNHLPTDQDTLNVDYSFQHGEVTISYNTINDSEYRLYFNVLTKDGLVFSALKRGKLEIDSID